jgi:uncharacterized protein (DUF4415 family)
MAVCLITKREDAMQTKTLGRPPLDQPAPNKLTIRISDALMEQFDDYRHANRINSRTDAIRRLIEDGLELNRITKRAK